MAPVVRFFIEWHGPLSLGGNRIIEIPERLLPEDCDFPAGRSRMATLIGHVLSDVCAEKCTVTVVE